MMNYIYYMKNYILKKNKNIYWYFFLYRNDKRLKELFFKNNFCSYM